jgi:hypothetical protein
MLGATVGQLVLAVGAFISGPLIMTYQVVPFVAQISNQPGENAKAAAADLQRLIDHMGGQGWDYVRLEQVETSIAPTKGCFGLGAQPGTSTSYTMAVFRR